MATACSKRLSLLREQLLSSGCETAIISQLEHVRYLSGFTGSSGWLIVWPNTQTLITDFRYKEQAADEAGECELEITGSGLTNGAGNLLAQRSKGSSVGFQSASISFSEYTELKSVAEKVELVPLVGLVALQSAVKDEDETALIAKAAKITDSLFDKIISFISVGMKEREVSAEIEYMAKKMGAEGMSFEPIVASGHRAALPHGVASDKVIEAGDMVTLDIGVFYRGYASDMTRTISMGPPQERLREVYGLVGRAIEAGLDAVIEGVETKTLDEVSRAVILDGGYGEMFGHSLGHGVGLQIHELPRISARSDETLRSGMVITIEPGIYIPGWGGVRTEDLIVVTEKGHRNLTSSSRELVVVE